MTDDSREEPHPPLPTPVRASLGAETTAIPAEDAELPSPEPTRFTGGGREWTVRLLGRSRGGPASAPVPLALLGFFGDPDAEAPEREALVVGRSLEDFTEAHLESAWMASAPAPREAPSRKPLFPEIGGRGRTRDG